jgi:uncharacterized protein YaaW (UPF0174 family)
MQLIIATKFNRTLNREIQQVVEIPENVAEQIVTERFQKMDYDERAQFVKDKCTVVGEVG